MEQFFKFFGLEVEYYFDFVVFGYFGGCWVRYKFIGVYLSIGEFISSYIVCI